jgi:MFS transporter, UMF1 family
MHNNTRKPLIAYSLFDFGNSAFTLIFYAYLFPLYLKQFILKDAASSDLTWGILLSSSALVGVFVGPMVGRWADRIGRWKTFSTIAGGSFVSALSLSLVIGGSNRQILCAFFIASSLFYLAANLYDSLLNSLVTGNQKVSFSGFAWGFGYLGGVLCFLGVFFLQDSFGLNSKIPYLFTSLFYTLFGVISLILLRRPLLNARGKPRVSFREMFAALTKERIGLLLGYFLIADTIGAVISFTALYASEELRLSTNAIGGFLLAVQLLAFPFTYLVCSAAVRRGTILILAWCVAIWIGILVLFVVRVNLTGMFLVTFLTALVIGSTQALMRAHYSDMLEKERDSELFGWYGIATESAAVIAPLLFGLASFTFDSKRLAMGLLIIPLCLGFVLVARCSRKLTIRLQAHTDLQ